MKDFEYPPSMPEWREAVHLLRRVYDTMFDNDLNHYLLKAELEEFLGYDKRKRMHE